MMFSHHSIAIISAIGAVCILISPPSVSAQEAEAVAGTLVCKGKGSVGLILGSTQSLDCTFKPTGKKPSQVYSGTITKIGLDVGVKGASTMIWTVLFATSELPAGALAGQYAGVSADASVGVGGGANVLVGGSNKSVALQPVSIQGQTGLNLAVGVSGLTLRAAR